MTESMPYGSYAVEKDPATPRYRPSIAPHFRLILKQRFLPSRERSYPTTMHSLCRLEEPTTSI